LAFNDLPSSIKASFTLTNARPLGMQEILAKFNAGSLRTVNVKRDFIEASTEGTDDEVRQTLEKNIGVGQYFDGIFDQFQNSMAPPENNGQGSGASPSSAGSNTGSGNNTANQNQIDAGVSVDVFVLGTPSTPGGTPSFTIEKRTLKDNGDAIASLQPEGSVVQGIDPNSSVFSSGFGFP
jgi:hypothetical protein